MNVARTITLLATAVGLASCSSQESPRVNSASVSQASSLLAEAEVLLERSRHLDYRAPGQLIRDDLADAAIRKFWEACVDGVPSACWRMNTIPYPHTVGFFDHEAMLQAGRNCLAGDKQSCVVLMSSKANMMLAIGANSPEAYMDACANGDTTACANAAVAKRCVIDASEAPECHAVQVAPPVAAVPVLVAALCHRGLGAACRAMAVAGEDLKLSEDQIADYAHRACALHDAAGCKAAANSAQTRGNARDVAYFLEQRDHALRVECAAGDAEACDDYDDPSAEAVATRACEAGFLAVCGLAHSAVAYETVCTATGYGCDKLAEVRNLYSLPYRDALEHGCQLDDLDLCTKLVDGYEAQRWPEPVVGRAAELTRLLCSKFLGEGDKWRAAHCSEGKQ